MDGATVSNLGPGYRFHYLPQAPEGHKYNLDSAEYANIVCGFLVAYRQARDAGMPALDSSRAKVVRAWTERVLSGYWTHAGYLNWDTGLGFKRWHQGKKLGLSQSALLGIAMCPELSAQSPWAKYMLDRSFELFDRWTERHRALPPANAFDVPAIDGNESSALLTAARVQANAAQAALFGLGEQQGSEPPPLYAYDPDVGRLAVTTPAYNTAIVAVTRGAFPYGGIELARLFDRDQDVAGGVGGRPPASFGVVVRSGGAIATPPSGRSRRRRRRRCGCSRRRAAPTANPQSYPEPALRGRVRDPARARRDDTRRHRDPHDAHVQGRLHRDRMARDRRARQAGRGPVPELGRRREGDGGHEVRRAQAGLQRDGALQRRPLPRRERALGLRRDVALRRVRRDRAGTAAERAVLGAEARADADRAGEGDDGRRADRAGQERG